MKALNLTHGGFYAHFKSKDELVEKALQAAAAELDAHCKMLFSQKRSLDAFIDSYLSQWHQTSRDQGCPLPTMSSELGLRGLHNPTTDAVLGARLKQVDVALGENANEQSLVEMSALVGALVLARVWGMGNGEWGMGNDQLATRIMDMVCESVKARALDKGKAGQ